MQVQPYLNFNGRCEEALAFYGKALGAKTEMLMRFKDSPDPSMVTPGSEEKVMHSASASGTTVLASTGGARARPISGFR
jgi:PhnB protein